MAIGVDSSKWKPRKIVGSPANKFRNALGIGILTVGLCTAAIFHYSPWTSGLRTATETLYEDPIEEIERRLLIGRGIIAKRGDTIRKQMEDRARLDRPDA